MFKLWFNSLWYGNKPLRFLLWPLSLVFRFVIYLRRFAYQVGLLKTTRFPIPIIVVGNLTVGGTGKTPLVIYIVKQLQSHGYRPGIISRGYGGRLTAQPILVTPSHSAHDVGDEVVMLARHCECPVVVAKNRVAAVAYLMAHTECNVVISDDGLQHYALARDIEIVVIDGYRRFGNGMCLPAGPLREPLNRLFSVDFVVCNGEQQHAGEYAMRLQPQQFINLKFPEQRFSPQLFSQQLFYAIAGIANPTRFFQTLSNLGYRFISHSFPDHYPFQATDFLFAADQCIVMTEKDAVKCNTFAGENFWYLAVEAVLDKSFIDALITKLYDERRHAACP